MEEGSDTFMRHGTRNYEDVREGKGKVVV